MRCIEIRTQQNNIYKVDRLTLTWDVLKFVARHECFTCLWININMRCIEITLSKWLNINSVRLTLTWDVLKLTYTSFVYAFIVD